jgi:hypothetical protein
MRLNAETKKNELSQISGDYSGSMLSLNETPRNIVLHLTVTEEPYSQNGEIDPIMMPKLSGFLKFPVGTSNASEYYSFKIVRGDFDPKRQNLDLVVEHAEFGEMKLTMSLTPVGFTGSWQANSLSLVGTITLSRTSVQPHSEPEHNQNGNEGNKPPIDQVAGAYVGFAEENKSNTHFLLQIILKSNTTPQGIALSADITIARGNNGAELATWKYDNIPFNPINGKLTLRKDSSSESFVGQLANGKISGDWYAASLGKLGRFEASSKSVPNSTLPRNAALSGVHDLCLSSFGGADLLEKSGISITVAQEPGTDGGIHVEASQIFYLGDYGSAPYESCHLSDVSLNFISGKFHGVCNSLPGTESFTVIGQIVNGEFAGTLTASGGRGAKLNSGRCRSER